MLSMSKTLIPKILIFVIFNYVCVWSHKWLWVTQCTSWKRNLDLLHETIQLSPLQILKSSFLSMYQLEKCTNVCMDPHSIYIHKIYTSFNICIGKHNKQVRLIKVTYLNIATIQKLQCLNIPPIKIILWNSYLKYFGSTHERG